MPLSSHFPLPLASSPQAPLLPSCYAKCTPFVLLSPLLPLFLETPFFPHLYFLTPPHVNILRCQTACPPIWIRTTFNTSPLSPVGWLWVQALAISASSGSGDLFPPRTSSPSAASCSDLPPQGLPGERRWAAPALAAKNFSAPRSCGALSLYSSKKAAEIEVLN